MTGTALLSLLLAQLSGAGLSVAAMALAQAGGPPAAESPWDAAMVTALFAGLIGTITAVSALVVAWYGAKAAKRATSEVGAQVEQVHKLVNNIDSAHREKVARLTRRIADITKDPNDIKAAEAAEHDVVTKAVVTAAATARRDEASEAAKRSR